MPRLCTIAFMYSTASQNREPRQTVRRQTVRCAWWVTVLCLVPVLAAADCLATVVVPMTLEQVADRTAVATTAKIVRVDAYWTGTPRRIESRVTIHVDEVLKGDTSLAQSEITFTSPGGRIGSLQYRIAGAPEWVPGERWILLLQDEYKTHPVVGIWHGAFKIVNHDDGSAGVETTAGNPVTNVESVVPGRTTIRATTSRNRRFERLPEAKHGRRYPTPAGQVNAYVRPVARSTPKGISPADFLDTLRPILRRSRGIGDGKTAGESVPVTLIPTTLKVKSETHGGKKRE